MDLRATVGNHLVVGFHGTKVDDNIKYLIHEYRIGSVILFARNLDNPNQISQLTYDLQQEAFKANYKYPLLICIDQENGIVRRLGEGTAVLPGAMSLGATGNKQYAYNTAKATAEELLALGINWNLSPVADINNNSNNPVIGVRSFGENPQAVSSYVVESMKGLQSKGVISTLKHFPGHGDTNVDSHLDLPTVSHDITRLNEIELVPFREGIEQGAEVIMTAHIQYPNIESSFRTPATLSTKILTELLREKLSFEGVITTDCMEMSAIAEGIGTGKGAVEALKAGADLVMISHDFDVQKRAIEDIIEAIKNKDLSTDQLEKSLVRLTKLKKRYLSWDKVREFDYNSFEIMVKKHQEMANDYYESSISVVKNNSMLPIKLNTPIVLLESDTEAQTLVEEKTDNYSMYNMLLKYTNSIIKINLNPEDDYNEIKARVNRLSSDNLILYTTSARELDNRHEDLVKSLNEKFKCTVISLRNPYLYEKLNDVDCYVNTYEDNIVVKNKLIQGLFGIVNLKGTSPVTL